MYIGGMRKPLLFALIATFALVGCRVEDTRPQIKNDSRLRAVIEAERKRAEALAKEQPAPAESPPENLTPPPRPTPGAPPAAAPAAAPPPPRYMPPSEQGAYVEMTETPAGTPPPPPGSKPAGASPAGDGGSRGQAQGPAGGNVPQGIAPNKMNGNAGAPPAGAPGRLGPPGGAPAVSGVRGPAGMPMGDAAATAAELKQNRAEFERLMRQQSAGGGDDASADETQGPGNGYGGPRAGSGNAGGHGASPDLSGEVGANPRPSAASAVRAPLTGDQAIVARQLREAAEREQDPALKRKLLLEYQKYTRP